MDSLRPVAYQEVLQTTSIHVMKKIYYEKVGRRYVPVSEYDSDYLLSFTRGNHLVMCYPGGKSTHYNIDPAFAPMIAASRFAEDKMREAVYEAASMHRQEHRDTELTPEQLRAWRKFEKVMGERGRYVQFKSTHDIVKTGLQVLEKEAAELMTHPAVRDAYEQFQAVCKLVKQTS